MSAQRLYAFHCGGEMTDYATVDPFHPMIGTKAEFPYFFYLIQHEDGNVLFDTGAHVSLIDDARSRLGDAAEDFTVKMEAGDDVVSRLATVGLVPADITHVVISHLHYDHSGGIEFFPDAEIVVQRSELQFAHWPPSYQRGVYIEADFRHGLRWRELDGQYDIFKDGSVVVFPTPGHTPGHQSLEVRLDSGKVLILVGDAAYLPRTLELNALPALVWSPDAMVSSWDVLRERRRQSDGELLFTHDIDWQTSTRLAPEQWYS